MCACVSMSWSIYMYGPYITSFLYSSRALLFTIYPSLRLLYDIIFPTEKGISANKTSVMHSHSLLLHQSNTTLHLSMNTLPFPVHQGPKVELPMPGQISCMSTFHSKQTWILPFWMFSRRKAAVLEGALLSVSYLLFLPFYFCLCGLD